MSTTIYSQEQLHTMIAPILRKYHAAYALLFGSYARKEATSTSDIDLVVVGKPEFRRFDVFAIAEDLHTCSGKHVDVYELNEIKKDSPIYQAIMKEGVILQ